MKFIILGLAILSVHTANAVVLLGTNFNGRVLETTRTTNDTATGLNWTTNGIADPGPLVTRASNSDPAEPFGFGDLTDFEANGLFQNGENANRFAPNLNIHSEGSWGVSIPLRVLGEGIVIDNVTLEAFSLNNGGNLQGVGRDLNVSISLFDPSLGPFSDALALQFQNVFVHGAVAPPQPTSVDFQLEGLMVPAGDYTLSLGFYASNDFVGNNAAFDNLVVNGSVIPEPSAGLLFVGGGCIALLRRRRADPS